MDGLSLGVADDDQYAMHIDALATNGAYKVHFGRGLILYTDDFTKGAMGFPGDGARAWWCSTSALTFHDPPLVVSQPELYREAARLGLVEVKSLSEQPHQPAAASLRTGTTQRSSGSTLLEKGDSTKEPQ